MSEEADPSSPSISQEELECGRNALTEFNKYVYVKCIFFRKHSRVRDMPIANMYY